jgi:6,7-dimethyl-8-ribityllumazine synthase
MFIRMHPWFNPPQMLRKIQQQKVRATGGSFAIVASRYNARYVDAMLRAAKAELWRAEVAGIEVVRVPGAYEIPVAAKHLARMAHSFTPDPAAFAAHPGGASPQRRQLSAIICLGVILRGETVHAEHIGEAVSRALMQIQLEREIPVVHEVLLLENKEQARVRCLGRRHNRGAEAAQTALAMARVMEKLRGN